MHFAIAQNNTSGYERKHISIHMRARLVSYACILKQERYLHVITEASVAVREGASATRARAIRRKSKSREQAFYHRLNGNIPPGAPCEL